MTTAETRKLFQPDNDGPDIALHYQCEHQHAYLWVRERTADGWERVGAVELHPALPTEYRGVCDADAPIVKWAYTEYHANGDRVRVGHRLVLTATDDGVRVTHEVEREETLGFGERDEHGWQGVERWDVTPEGVGYTEQDGDSNE